MNNTTILIWFTIHRLLVEHPLCDQEVVGSNSGRFISETLKIVHELAALLLGTWY